MWTYLWLGIFIMSLVFEFLTSDLLSVWFAGGALVSMVLAICGVAWYVHVIVFFVLSFALLFCFRKLALKIFNKEESKTNADAVIGKEFDLLANIGFNKAGEIKINDVIWSAVCEDVHTEIKEGARVKVVGIKGNKYIVMEVEK